MSKIKKEQLEKIQDQQSRLQSILTDIGVIEVRKHEALHAQAAVSQEIQASKKELEEEYGAVTIDMSDGSYKTGEYTKIEDESKLKVAE
jgi:hypothetical protein